LSARLSGREEKGGAFSFTVPEDILEFGPDICETGREKTKRGFNENIHQSLS